MYYRPSQVVLVVKNLPANAGDIRDMGSISGLGTSPFFPGKNDRVGCHFLLQGGLPDPGIEPTSLVSLALAGKFFTTSTNWEAVLKLYMLLIVTYDMSLNHINRERSGWRLHGPSEGQRSFHLMVVSTPSSTFPSSCSLESSMNT